MALANLIQLEPYNLNSASSYTFANVTATGIVSTTGNVTGNYFIGNGSQLTGIAASGGTSNARAFGYTLVFGV